MVLSFVNFMCDDIERALFINFLKLSTLQFKSGFAV